MNIDILQPSRRHHAPAKITAVARGNGHTYVGLASGTIQIVKNNQLHETGASVRGPVSSLKAGRQLAAESNGLITTHRYQDTSLKLFHTIKEPGNGPFEWLGNLLFVSHKKKLTVYDFSKDNAASTTITLKDKIRLLTALGDTMLVGLSYDFVVVHPSLEVEELPLEGITSTFSYFGMSYSETRVVVMDPVHLLLVRESQVLALEMGEGIEESPVKFAGTPLAVTYVAPHYVVAVYAKRIDVVETDLGNVIQRLPLAVGSSVFLTGGDHTLWLAHGPELLELEVLDFDAQIKQYLGIRGAVSPLAPKSASNDLRLMGLDRAIALVYKVEPTDPFFGSIRAKTLYLRDLHTKKLRILFEWGNYREAVMDIGCEWIVSPTKVLELYPDFLSSDKKSARERSNSIVTQTLVADLDDLDNPSTRKFSVAVTNLIVYLTDQRRILLSFLVNKPIDWKGIEVVPADVYGDADVENTAKVIDTTLFLCYFYTKPMLLGPLLRIPNRCDADVVHAHLETDLSYTKELLDFYFGRRLHENALGMLASRKDAELLIQYLQRLGNDQLALVLEYASWLVEQDPKNSQAIFMNDSAQCDSYNAFEVLDFLKDEKLAVQYLEWIVSDSDKPERKSLKIHTRLCLLYLKHLKEKRDEKVYDKLYELLRGTTYEPWTVLKHIPTDSDNSFLRLSVLVYRRLGEHDRLVDVLFNQLDDLELAMAYCLDIYLQPHNQHTGKTLLHKLLEDLLIHYDENIDRIAYLLAHEGQKMSNLQVLTALPDSFPLHKLGSYLTSTIRHAQASVHDLRAAANLYSVGRAKSKHKLLTTEAEAVSVQSANQPCAICQKRLGYTVFSVDHSGQVIHYGCR